MLCDCPNKLLNAGNGCFAADPAFFSELNLFMLSWAGCSLTLGVGDACDSIWSSMIDGNWNLSLSRLAVYTLFRKLV